MVEDGRVALGGPILESEHRRVLRTARRVLGVRGLDDWLEEHHRPDIPELSDGPTSRAPPVAGAAAQVS